MSSSLLSVAGYGFPANKIKNLTWTFFFFGGGAPSDVQGLLLVMYSGIAYFIEVLEGTKWGAGIES